MSEECKDSRGFFDRAMEKIGHGYKPVVVRDDVDTSDLEIVPGAIKRVKEWNYDLDRIPPGGYVDLLMHCGDIVRAVRARSFCVFNVRTGEMVDRDLVRAWRRA